MSRLSPRPCPDKARTMNHRINRSWTLCSSKSQNNSIPILAPKLYLHTCTYIVFLPPILLPLPSPFSPCTHSISLHAYTPAHTCSRALSSIRAIFRLQVFIICFIFLYIISHCLTYFLFVYLLIIYLLTPLYKLQEQCFAPDLASCLERCLPQGGY